MRPRTRLDVEVHGNVAEGNGGRGKISRQRPESAGSPNWAAPPEASKPLALSYIPEILESMATVCSGAERRSLGGLAPVTPETNSHETPEIASNCQEKIEKIAKELELKKDRLG